MRRGGVCDVGCNRDEELQWRPCLDVMHTIVVVRSCLVCCVAQELNTLLVHCQCQVSDFQMAQLLEKYGADLI